MKLTNDQKKRLVENDMGILFNDTGGMSSNWGAMCSASIFGQSGTNDFSPHINPALRLIEKTYNNLSSLSQNVLYAKYSLMIRHPYVELTFGVELSNIVYMSRMIKTPGELLELTKKFHQGAIKHLEKESIKNKINLIRIEAEKLLFDAINEYINTKYSRK